MAEDRTAWRQATRRGVERADEKNTSMRLRRGCGENKKQHYHQCHPVSSALAAARTATQESAFTATVNAAKIQQVDNGAHQHRLLETTLCLLLYITEISVLHNPSCYAGTLVTIN